MFNGAEKQMLPISAADVGLNLILNRSCSGASTPVHSAKLARASQ